MVIFKPSHEFLLTGSTMILGAFLEKFHPKLPKSSRFQRHTRVACPNFWPYSTVGKHESFDLLSLSPMHLYTRVLLILILQISHFYTNKKNHDFILRTYGQNHNIQKLQLRLYILGWLTSPMQMVITFRVMEVWYNNKIDSCREMNQKNHTTFHG